MSGITTFELILDKFFLDIELKSCVLFKCRDAKYCVSTSM